MAITKADVIEAVDELVDALARFSARAGREIELIVRADGTASLMGGDEPATSFEEVARFDSVSDLWTYLNLAGRK